MAQETQTGALYQPRGVGVEWRGRWEGGSKGRGYMYTYTLIHYAIRLKLTQCCKSTILNKLI